MDDLRDQILETILALDSVLHSKDAPAHVKEQVWACMRKIMDYRDHVLKLDSAFDKVMLEAVKPASGGVH